MSITALLPDPAAIHLDYIRPSLSAITLIVRTTATHAECCHCHRTSSCVHSRYTRSVADLPWHGVSVKLELHTRRFRCQNSLCTRRIFCERVPSVVAHYARKTVRLNAALELIGFAIGGEAVPASHGDSAMLSARTPCYANFEGRHRVTHRHPASSESMTLLSVGANDTAHCSSIWSGAARLISSQIEKLRH